MFLFMAEKVNMFFLNRSAFRNWKLLWIHKKSFIFSNMYISLLILHIMFLCEEGWKPELQGHGC